MNTDHLFTAVHKLKTARFEFRLLEEAQLIADFLAQTCPNPTLAALGFSELFVNAIEHGNLGIFYDEKNKLLHGDEWLDEVQRRLQLPEYMNKTVKVDYTRTDSEIIVKVTDEGKGFDWRKPKEENDNSKEVKEVKESEYHGRGIDIIKGMVFQKVEYSGRGNEVTCFIKL